MISCKIGSFSNRPVTTASIADGENKQGGFHFNEKDFAKGDHYPHDAQAVARLGLCEVVQPRVAVAIRQSADLPLATASVESLRSKVASCPPRR